VPVHVRRDIPGFVGNRLQHAMKREAFALVGAGVCDAETIDTVVKEGFGARTAVLGPMEQSDLVGLDLALDIAEVLYEHLDSNPTPHPILREKVKAGKLGMKTGEGLRSWASGEADAVRARLSRFLVEQAMAKKSTWRRG
jgi:3-hydroxybutyryl-CoA dehydrogenase